MEKIVALSCVFGLGWQRLWDHLCCWSAWCSDCSKSNWQYGQGLHDSKEFETFAACLYTSDCFCTDFRRDKRANLITFD